MFVCVCEREGESSCGMYVTFMMSTLFIFGGYSVDYL